MAAPAFAGATSQESTLKPPWPIVIAMISPLETLGLAADVRRRRDSLPVLGRAAR